MMKQKHVFETIADMLARIDAPPRHPAVHAVPIATRVFITAAITATVLAFALRYV